MQVTCCSQGRGSPHKGNSRKRALAEGHDFTFERGEVTLRSVTVSPWNVGFCTFCAQSPLAGDAEATLPPRKPTGGGEPGRSVQMPGETQSFAGSCGACPSLLGAVSDLGHILKYNTQPGQGSGGGRCRRWGAAPLHPLRHPLTLTPPHSPRSSHTSSPPHPHAAISPHPSPSPDPQELPMPNPALPLSKLQKVDGNRGKPLGGWVPGEGVCGRMLRP